MIDESLMNSLSAEDKEAFKKGLQDIIEQTYVIENEYKVLNESYLSLQSFIKQIVETLPNSIWVLEESGEIFLQNSEAEKNSELLAVIDKTKTNDEIEFKSEYYLVKNIQKDDKLIITATDITEEKRKERLASMGQVAAHLSHEIRNPIGSVSLLASTLFNKVDITCKPIVLEMKRSIWRVERIIKATLLFTKGVQTNKEPFALDEFEAICEQAISHYTYSKEIEFDISFPNGTINADKELLALVIQNLLFNAIDAIEECEKEDGKVALHVKQDTTKTTFYVEDNGKSIKDENILFEPFKTTKTKGNGLGLTLSKQIVEAHGGLISVQKKPKCFCVTIENG